MRTLCRVRLVGRLLVNLVLVAAVLAACAPGARPSVNHGSPALIQPPRAPNVTVSPGLKLVAGPLPFPFEQNHGQAPADVAYLLRAGDLQAAFGAHGVSYRLLAGESADPTRPMASGPPPPRLDRTRWPSEATREWLVEQTLVDAHPAPPVGAHPAETRVSYLKGPAEHWLTDLPTFHQLVRENAWTGIDVAYERSGAGLKSTYLVAPGADPSQILLAWTGGAPRLGEDGALQIETPGGVLRESAPVAWQESGSQQVPVAVRWRAAEDGPEERVWGFEVGAYDPSQPLIIDPTVLYATYLGGSGVDSASHIALDASGVAYVTGHTFSTEATFPNGSGLNGLGLTGFDQTSNGSADAFVAKLGPNGQTLLYLTFIGGSGVEFVGDIAVDSAGAAYLAGDTDSTEATFPNGGGLGSLPGPGFDQAHNGSSDAFVVKLSPNGQNLLYGTYIGGSSEDRVTGIAVDSSGSAYLTGRTLSTEATFPNGLGFAALGVPGLNQIFNGGFNDGFVVKLRPDGGGLEYGTYIGGSNNDVPTSIAVDSSGAAYLVGLTDSDQTMFPDGDPNASDQIDVQGFDRTYNGGGFFFDAFALKLAPGGQSLLYATYLGGSSHSIANSVVIDDSGAAYIVGETESPHATFPNGNGFASLSGVPGFDQFFNGVQDAFVVKLAPSGQTLEFATYLGGNNDDRGNDIALDGSGAVHVVGHTQSSQATFPNGGGFGALSVPGFDQTFNGGGSDIFVAKLSANGQSLADATYLGGAGNESSFSFAVDGSGNAYVAGDTTSTEGSFPGGSGLAGLGAPGFDQTANGDRDGFIVKLGPTATATATPTSTPTPTVSLTPTVTPTWTVTPTATATATSTAAPIVTAAPTTTPFACGPRPTVEVEVLRLEPERLQVTITPRTEPATPGNRLTQLRATIPANVRVDVLNGPGDLTGPQLLPIGNGTHAVVFFLRRIVPGPVTLPLVAVDSCGEWPTFVGGGNAAF